MKIKIDMSARQINSEPLNKAAAARLLGISKQAIYKFCKSRFRPALVGKKVNIKHPLIIEYIEQRAANMAAIDQEVPPKSSAKPLLDHKDKKTIATTQEPHQYTPQYPQNVGGIPFEELEDLTIKEVITRYGTIAGFKLYLDSLRGMADWKNKELKFLERRMELVEINPFADTIFALVDLAFKRIVGEFPGAIAPQLKAIMRADKEDATIQMIALMNKELSQILKSCKSKVIRDVNKKKKQSTIF